MSRWTCYLLFLSKCKSNRSISGNWEFSIDWIAHWALIKLIILQTRITTFNISISISLTLSIYKYIYKLVTHIENVNLECMCAHKSRMPICQCNMFTYFFQFNSTSLHFQFNIAIVVPLWLPFYSTFLFCCHSSSSCSSPLQQFYWVNFINKTIEPCK